jgi:hypothetical protein
MSCPYVSRITKLIDSPLSIERGDKIVEKVEILIQLCSHPDQKKDGRCTLQLGKVCNYIKIMSSLYKYLGHLGKDLPELNEEDWEKIFQFIENFLVVEFDEHDCKMINIDWKRLKEILDLLDKVK